MCGDRAAVACAHLVEQTCSVLNGSEPRLSEWRKVLAEEWGDPLPDQLQPDGVVGRTTAEDWQAVFDLICGSNWGWKYVDKDGAEAPLPGAAEALRTVEGDRHPILIVWLPTDVHLILYLYGPESIDFDFDLDEIGDQDSLDGLCEAVRSICQTVRKDVALSHQGAGGEVFCVYRHVDDSFALAAP